MRKTAIIFALAGLLVFAGSCKRSSIDDPGVIITPDVPSDLSSLTISGRITTTVDHIPNLPLANVEVNLSGPLSRHAVTDVNGNYTLTNIPLGVSGLILTPLKAGYEMTPASFTLTNSIVTNFSNIDFTSLDTEVPEVKFIEPTGGVVSFPLDVKIEASDTAGNPTVKLSVFPYAGTFYPASAVVPTPPYFFKWMNLPVTNPSRIISGRTYTLYAVASDAAGNSAQAMLIVTAE